MVLYGRVYEYYMDGYKTLLSQRISKLTTWQRVTFRLVLSTFNNILTCVYTIEVLKRGVSGK